MAVAPVGRVLGHDRRSAGVRRVADVGWGAMEGALPQVPIRPARARERGFGGGDDGISRHLPGVREATKYKHLFKPKKRKRLIALGLVSLIAGSALMLTPEVEEKGGWSFVTQATVFLIALPHLEDPRSWDLNYLLLA